MTPGLVGEERRLELLKRLTRAVCGTSGDDDDGDDDDEEEVEEKENIVVHHSSETLIQRQVEPVLKEDLKEV